MRVIMRDTEVTVIVSKKDLPSVDRMASNIVKLYRTASSDNQKSILWYSEANRFALHLSSKYGVSVDLAAKVIAVLSPLTRWEVNQVNADLALSSFFDTGTVSRQTHIFSANVEKVQTILMGEPVTLGPKVSAFYANIMGEDDLVTVDSIAASIAVGWAQYPGSYKLNKAALQKIADAYVKAAFKVSCKPSELQAVTWVIARKLKKSNRGKGRELLSKTSF